VVKVVVDVQNKFSPVINSYINFLQGNKLDIGDVSYYKPCFDMHTYFDGSEYLDYLISQTLKHWSIVSDFVYDELIPELRWQVFLYSSYQAIPQHYLLDIKFYLEWAKLNVYIEYEDSNGGRYYNNIPMHAGRAHFGNNIVHRNWHGVKVSSTNGSSNSEVEGGYGLEVSYYSEDGNIKYICEKWDGEAAGKYIKCYTNTSHTIQSIIHFDCNVTSIEVYVDGQLQI